MDSEASAIADIIQAALAQSDVTTQEYIRSAVEAIHN
jgi:hypothetical protein